VCRVRRSQLLPPPRMAHSRDARVDRLAVELGVKESDGQDGPAVVERSPLGVNDHVRANVLALARDKIVAKLGDLADLLEVGAVGARAKDGADDGRPVLVRGRKHRSDRIVDERADEDVDVLAVERVLKELDDVVADRVRRAEALGPRQDLARGERRLLNRESAGTR
jgi:hypothetical protein